MLPNKKRPLLIACAILREEINALRDKERIRAATHFLSAQLHSDPQRLKAALTSAMALHRRKYGRRIVVVYGDACLGFNGEMGRLVEAYGLTKVRAVNCIDCQLGGCGRLLEIDPDHRYFFLNRAFLRFGRKSLFTNDPATVRDQFRMLTAIIPIDPLGDLDAHWNEIQRISALTGLPLREKLDVGLDGVEKVIAEAINRLPEP